MGNRNGSISLEILVAALIVSFFAFFGNIRIKNARTVGQVNNAKILIADTYKKYATISFDKNVIHRVIIDYNIKIIEIFDNIDKKIEEIVLPKEIKYATIYGGIIQDKMNAKITEQGNITPIFSIYIFDNKDIAKYRISLYGFDTLKHLRINIYKNKSDKTANYANIIKFHDSFTEESNKLWEKE
ncbi:MAG: hypothetical protein LBT51_11110 [Fusobacteriaceae bacterium]|jgi:hypothetical protein|nr:hypothetical protein [Fusobacteriaceae bacterium]